MNLTFFKVNINGKYFAMKQQSASTIYASVPLNERKIMIKLDHENVVKIVGAFFDRDPFILTELCWGKIQKIY